MPQEPEVRPIREPLVELEHHSGDWVILAAEVFELGMQLLGPPPLTRDWPTLERWAFNAGALAQPCRPRAAPFLLMAN